MHVASAIKMKNQTAAAGATVLQQIDWEKVDLQVIIEAGNRGLLGGPLTNWLAEQKWVGVFGKLDTVTPVEKGEVIRGKDFVARSRELAKKAGKKTLGQEAYDFYKKSENWGLMPPEDSGVNVVAFVEARLGSGGSRRVRCLCRFSAGWHENYYWLGGNFHGEDRVAVSQA